MECHGGKVVVPGVDPGVDPGVEPGITKVEFWRPSRRLIEVHAECHGGKGAVLGAEHGAAKVGLQRPTSRFG